MRRIWAVCPSRQHARGRQAAAQQLGGVQRAGPQWAELRIIREVTSRCELASCGEARTAACRHHQVWLRRRLLCVSGMFAHALAHCVSAVLAGPEVASAYTASPRTMPALVYMSIMSNGRATGSTARAQVHSQTRDRLVRQRREMWPRHESLRLATAGCCSPWRLRFSVPASGWRRHVDRLVAVVPRRQAVVQQATQGRRRCITTSPP